MAAMGCVKQTGEPISVSAVSAMLAELAVSSYASYVNVIQCPGRPYMCIV